MYSFFEKERVLLTSLLKRCLTVLLSRSTCAVSPVSLPTSRWVASGRQMYERQKSLKLLQRWYS